ncbi:MAG: hypothetical protein VB119_00650 [Candidatus Metalachnospira sp.]|nr:hypothetical protein [Candidatus Metalachnospira sp.]
MNRIMKKIAYLRGLCEGYGFSEETKEGKILLGILQILDDMAEEAEDNGEWCTECDDDEEAEYSYAFICPNCGQELEVDDEVLHNETELTCPACGNIIPVIDEFANFEDEKE